MEGGRTHKEEFDSLRKKVPALNGTNVRFSVLSIATKISGCSVGYIKEIIELKEKGVLHLKSVINENNY